MHSALPTSRPRRRHATLRRRRLVSGLAAATSLALVAACGGTDSGDAASVEIVVFQPPSLGAFLPAVIEERGIDAEHDVDITFTHATPDNYNTEFGAGHYDVGGSAALLSEALRTEREGDVTYLFNLFDYFGAVVTSNPDIEKLTDLEGRTLAAATGTTNYAMFQWFAQQQGVDLDQVDAQNQTTSGLSTMAATGRTDAVQLWEPAYSTLLANNSDIRTVDMQMQRWEEEFGTSDIPYLGVAAQSDWVEENEDAASAVYDTYSAAADWAMQNPAEAAEIIAGTIPEGDPGVIENLINNNDETLQMRVAPASEVADGMQAVFEAGQQTGYLEQQPPESLIYEGLQ